jgi:hypothetical protein
MSCRPGTSRPRSTVEARDAHSAEAPGTKCLAHPIVLPKAGGVGRQFRDMPGNQIVDFDFSHFN